MIIVYGGVFMKKILFQGCGTAIATPFTENGINFSEFENLVEFQIQQGVDAIIVCGTTGESSTMSIEEKEALIKYAVHIVNKRVPVIAGTGGNNTKEVIRMSKFAESVGVEGLLIVTPYYNKTTQLGLIKHYTEVASSVQLPIILYNVPSRTGVNISPETCYELSKLQNIVAIKEASGNISQVAKISSLCKDDLAIYSGNDDQVLPILSLGGLGVISVLSNIIPKEVCTMVHEYKNGNVKNALDLQLKYLKLIELLFCEVNPIPIKSAINMLGYSFGSPRLPLIEMSNENKEKLRLELNNLSIL